MAQIEDEVNINAGSSDESILQVPPTISDDPDVSELTDLIYRVIDLKFIKTGLQCSETAREYLQKIALESIMDPETTLEFFAGKDLVESRVAEVDALLNEAKALEERKEWPDVTNVVGSDEYDSEAEVNEHTDKELLKKNDMKWFNLPGGSYKQIRGVFEPTKEVLEVNHMPPNAAYKGTKYQNIHVDHRPAICMHKRHHRNLPSTFDSGEFSVLLKRSMEKNFSHALIADIAVFWLQKFISEYVSSLTCMLKYCLRGHTSHPPEAKGVFKKELITEEQYLYLQDVLKEMIENKFDGTNISLLNKWIPSDVIDREELLDYLNKVPENHFAKRTKGVGKKLKKRRGRKRKRLFSVAKRSSKCKKTKCSA